MTRPDGLVLVAVSGAFKIGEAVARIRAATGTLRPLARELARAALWLAGFAIVFAPYFAWRYTTYGWLYPNTYYAKVGIGLDQYDRGLRYLASFLEESGGWLVLLAPLAITMTSIRRERAIYVFALLVAWMAYVAYVGGDSLLRFRFFAPLMPLFYALAVASVAALSRRHARRRTRRDAGSRGRPSCSSPPLRSSSPSTRHPPIRIASSASAAPSTTASRSAAGSVITCPARRPSPPCRSAPSATNRGSPSSICSVSTTNTSPTAMSRSASFPPVTRSTTPVRPRQAA